MNNLPCPLIKPTGKKSKCVKKADPEVDRVIDHLMDQQVFRRFMREPRKAMLVPEEAMKKLGLDEDTFNLQIKYLARARMLKGVIEELESNVVRPQHLYMVLGILKRSRGNDYRIPPDPATACYRLGRGLPYIPEHHDERFVVKAIAWNLAAEILLPADDGFTPLGLEMYYFIMKAYLVAEWSPTSNIAACCLVMRWLQQAFTLQPNALTLENWKRTIFTALIVAQKLTDDEPLKNRQFLLIWKHANQNEPALELQTIHALERQFVADLKYKIFVWSRQMTKFYFALVGHS